MILKFFPISPFFWFEILATLAYNLIASSQAALKKIPFEKKKINGEITQNICSALSLIEKKNKNFNYPKKAHSFTRNLRLL